MAVVYQIGINLALLKQELDKSLVSPLGGLMESARIFLILSIRIRTHVFQQMLNCRRVPLGRSPQEGRFPLVILRVEIKRHTVMAIILQKIVESVYHAVARNQVEACHLGGLL